MLKYVNQHGCWVFDFDWCYAESMLYYVIKQLSINNYPYKSQFKSGADVRNGSVRFQILLKIYWS